VVGVDDHPAAWCGTMQPNTASYSYSSSTTTHMHHTQSMIAAAAHSMLLGFLKHQLRLCMSAAIAHLLRYSDTCAKSHSKTACPLLTGPTTSHSCCRRFGCNRELSAQQLSAYLSFTRMSGRAAEGRPGSLLRRIASCSELMRLNVGLPLSPPPTAALPPAAAAGEACPPGSTGGRSTDVKAFR
jgi:hypothetical protein